MFIIPDKQLKGSIAKEMFIKKNDASMVTIQNMDFGICSFLYSIFSFSSSSNEKIE